MNTYTVVMLEKMSALGIRIRKILEGSKVCVIDTDNEMKLFNTLYNSEQTVSLVILDLELPDDYAMKLLAETRARADNAPIIVLSPSRSREFFIEALLHGATDFIIKPFVDQVFVSKIFKYLVPEEANKFDLVTVDLPHYIKGELRKAEKGGFPLSILFLNFESGRPEDGKDTETATAFLYDNLRDLFWDTDIFIRLLSNHFFGIFPFCDEKSKTVIDAKLKTRFADLKQKNAMLRGYGMFSVFVSYPYDTKDASSVYELLLSRIRGN